jgi:hypothetical protein
LAVVRIIRENWVIVLVSLFLGVLILKLIQFFARGFKQQIPDGYALLFAFSVFGAIKRAQSIDSMKGRK